MKKPKAILLLFGDLLAYLYAIVPGIIAWTMVIAFIAYFDFKYWSIAFGPVILLFGFIFTCLIFRIILPPLKPGLYRPGFDLQVILWHLNNSLANALENAGLKTAIYSFHITRWLYWRAMGMKVPFGVICSTLVTFREYPLITVEKGVSFSAYNHVSCHTFEGERLLLGKIHIGENSFVGMNTIVGPRTTIGKDCFIGVNNILLFDKIKDGEKVDNFQYEYGNPRLKKYPLHAKSAIESLKDGDHV